MVENKNQPPQEFVVRVWQSGNPTDDRRICKTEDDLMALISDVNFNAAEKTRVEVEPTDVVG